MSRHKLRVWAVIRKTTSHAAASLRALPYDDANAEVRREPTGAQRPAIADGGEHDVDMGKDIHIPWPGRTAYEQPGILVTHGPRNRGFNRLRASRMGQHVPAHRDTSTQTHPHHGANAPATCDARIVLNITKCNRPGWPSSHHGDDGQPGLLHLWCKPVM